MESGQVWYKRRQRPKRARFFAIKDEDDFGFSAVSMAAGAAWGYCFIGEEELEGFERRNELLTVDRIAKFILLGDLNTIIL